MSDKKERKKSVLKTVCPLLSISHQGFVESCIREKCAWWIARWDFEGCAVKLIAASAWRKAWGLVKEAEGGEQDA